MRRLDLIWLFLWISVVCMAQTAAGWFESTGSMVQARFGHSATLLKDGRVLIVGGQSADGRLHLASAELYDPATRTFRATGSLNVARSFHQAVLLGDGRVLIAGNGGPQFEIYDPATELFQKAGNAQGFHGPGSLASLLPDGRVALIGTDLEIFDPRSQESVWLGRFNSTGGIALADGRILAQGADPSRGIALLRVLETEGGAKETASLSLGYQWLGRAMVRLESGDVLIAGGGDYSDFTTDFATVFDARTNKLRSVAPMRTSRSGFPMVRLPDNRVLITGGYSDTIPGGFVPDAELFDPAKAQFVPGGRDPFGARSSHSATLLQDGRVLLAGGFLNYYQGTNQAALYTPEPRVISAASRTEAIAPGSLVSLFGVNLSAATEAASGPALPTSLGGVSVRVRDQTGTERLARLMYVSPTQINFELPAETAVGGLTIRTVGSPQENVSGGWVSAVAPGLFTRAGDEIAAYATRLESTGARTVLPSGEPITLDDRPVYLAIYGTGIRARSSLEQTWVEFNGTRVPAEYAGPSGEGTPGLDQLNVKIPASLRGTGLVDVTCVVDGARSNVGRLVVR